MKEMDKNGKARKKDWLFLLVFFLLGSTNLVFLVLCLYHTKVEFFIESRIYFIILAIVGICAICGISVYKTIKGTEVWRKILLTIQFFLCICLVLIYIFQKSGFFEMVNTPEKLQAFLRRAGIWMPMLYILLQYLQVIVLPIPSIVSTVAGVALFGPFFATIYSLVGILLGSITAFYVGRKFGYKAVAWIVGEETLKTWREKLKGKDNILLTLMFLLPLFPDDILCFVAGLSSMRVGYFLIMVFLARTVGILGTCYSVDIIPFNTWWGILIWAVLIITMLFAFVFLSKNADRVQKFIKRAKLKLRKQKK